TRSSAREQILGFARELLSGDSVMVHHFLVCSISHRESVPYSNARKASRNCRNLRSGKRMQHGARKSSDFTMFLDADHHSRSARRTANQRLIEWLHRVQVDGARVNA